MSYEGQSVRTQTGYHDRLHPGEAFAKFVAENWGSAGMVLMLAGAVWACRYLAQ